MHPIPFSYNFPAVKESKAAAENPYKKLHEELAEVDEADECGRSVFMSCALRGVPEEVALPKIEAAREHLLEEILDLYHATETLLRNEFTADEVFAMRNKVIEKNEMRGYYEED